MLLPVRSLLNIDNTFIVVNRSEQGNSRFQFRKVHIIILLTLSVAECTNGYVAYNGGCAALKTTSR